MKRFWDAVILPLLDMSKARHVIEIGAFRGENSRNIARWCSRTGARFDCIDPLPDFDTAALVAVAPACVTIHRALSLQVLGSLLPADVVLVDGDHNWHTVHGEMRLLYGQPGPLGPDAPIAICHDVGWPYGRRDMYYDPATLPQGATHPHAAEGVSPYVTGLTPCGINANLQNAKAEGGPRNGVRTAIEDALSDRLAEVDILWLDAFFGLAVIVPRARLAANPALAALLRDMTPSKGLRKLLRLMEKERIDGLLSLTRLARYEGTPPALQQAASARPDRSDLPAALGAKVGQGTATQTWRGHEMPLNPFDLANLLQLLQDVAPGTVFEIGAAASGRSLWLADMMQALTGKGGVIGVDARPSAPFTDPRIRWHLGDPADLASVLQDADLAALPRPWIVIADAAQAADVTPAVLDFFDPRLCPGDWLLVEDGTLMGSAGAAAASQAAAALLARRRERYRLAVEYCDRYGYNLTGRQNGWLERI